MVLLDPIGQDLDRLQTPHRKKRNRAVTVVVDIITVVFFSICVFAFVNFPSLVLIGTYLVTPEEVQYNFPSAKETQSQAVAVVDVAPAKVPGVKQYPDNTVFIPKIGVQAPIGWDTTSGQVADALEKNVVHLDGTSKPGGYGNIFITGHSSNYWWKEGDYNTVFALLPQLVEGDEIIVTYKGEFHHYKVTGSEEMKSSEVSKHLESDKEKLTIMTCTPVGTNLRRLLVYADPIN